MNRAPPVVLTALPLAESEIALIASRYRVVLWSTAHQADVATLGTVRAIVVGGQSGLGGLDLDLCGSLGLVHCLGTGHDGIALAALAARGVRVSSAGGVHSAIVADHALALWLASLRRVVAHDQAVRGGGWSAPVVPSRASGRRVGLLGFGSIGRQVARRLAGFDCELAYHSRRPVAAAPERHFAVPLELAAWSDDVIAVLPGGVATRHMVDAAFLRALGPGGHLVNVGRGSVVSTAALVAALDAGAIAGAALDVVDEEPDLPGALRQHPKVVLTPHAAGLCPDTRRLLLDRALENLDAYFRTGKPSTPVREDEP